MSKFKVGDKVRLKGTKTASNSICWDGWSKMTHKKKGNIVEIYGERDQEYNIKIRDQVGWFTEKDFELAKKGKPQKLTHVIIYDLQDRDPVIFCYSEREMKAEVQALHKKEEVIKDSIRIIEVKRELKPVINVGIKEVK